MVQPKTMDINSPSEHRTRKSHDIGKTGRTPVKWLGILLAALIGTSLIVGAVSAETPSDPFGTTGTSLYVSSITYDPVVFFTNDRGTVEVFVTNGNANQTVTVNHALFSSKDIKRTSGTYDSSSTIGPQETRSFTFSVVADGQDGTYYPTFSLSYLGSYNLWHQAVVQIDNTPLLLLITDEPDTFAQGRKDTITAQIANPRNNEVKNVILSVSGANSAITPSQTYIGKLAPGESTSVNITVTPNQPTTLELNVDYSNGYNVHTVSTSLPVTFSDDKTQANPVLSNIEVTTTGGVYHVKGDVTNAGLQTANGMTVTSLSPAVPQDPYQSYVIGSLKPDDFGSFKVTFSADGITNVPLQLSYKDKDGNVKTSLQYVSLAGATSTDATGAQPGILPVIAIVIIIACAGGGYLYLKRRKIQ
ncbi:MAG: CARDB domain-containing protein [Methanoregulaceae archaeon]|jgi:hypothetical protein